MNFETVKGHFKDWKRDMEAKWCHLTDDDWSEIEGSRDKLIAKIQEKYGRSREEARREVDDFWIEQVIRRHDQSWSPGHNQHAA